MQPARANQRAVDFHMPGGTPYLDGSGGFGGAGSLAQLAQLVRDGGTSNFSEGKVAHTLPNGGAAVKFGTEVNVRSFAQECRIDESIANSVAFLLASATSDSGGAALFSLLTQLDLTANVGFLAVGAEVDVGVEVRAGHAVVVAAAAPTSATRGAR